MDKESPIDLEKLYEPAIAVQLLEKVIQVPQAQKEHLRKHPKLTLRDEANAITVYAFRNSCLEDLHAGVYSPLLEDDSLCRITDKEMKKLMKDGQTLGSAVKQAIREQARKKSFTFKTADASAQKPGEFLVRHQPSELHGVGHSQLARELPEVLLRVPVADYSAGQIADLAPCQRQRPEP